MNDKIALLQMVENNVPVEQRVFGQGHLLRPQFIQPYRSKNVLIEGVTITNSPMWIIHPVLCENVIIRNVILNRCEIVCLIEVMDFILYYFSLQLA